jgi:hypothetical protein
LENGGALAGNDYWRGIMANLASRSFDDPDGGKGCQNQSAPHTRNRRNFPPDNLKNRETAPDT